MYKIYESNKQGSGNDTPERSPVVGDIFSQSEVEFVVEGNTVVLRTVEG